MWKNEIKGEYCMKNWKQNAVIGMVAIMVISFGIVACDDGNGKDDPKDQSQIITLTFGETLPTATVKGHLTDTEWNGVADKIKDAINGRYSTSGNAVQSAYQRVFGKGITITVEKTSAYANYKTTSGGNIMYINFSILDNEEALKMAIFNAMSVIDEQEVPAQG
jgi:hypothetical protein